MVWSTLENTPEFGATDLIPSIELDGKAYKGEALLCKSGQEFKYIWRLSFESHFVFLFFLFGRFIVSSSVSANSATFRRLRPLRQPLQGTWGSNDIPSHIVLLRKLHPLWSGPQEGQ